MPQGLLSPTLLRFVSSALSHKMFFFWPNLRCKVIEPMVKSRYLVRFPLQKKQPKRFQNLGRFKKKSSAQWPKKSPQNWTRLSLNMVRGNRFSNGKHLRKMENLRLKVRTQRRPAQFSCGDLPPKRRSNRNVLWRAFNLMVTKLYFQGPKM